MKDINEEQWNRMHYEQVLLILKKHKTSETQQWIEQIEAFEQFSLDEKHCFCIFSHKKRMPIYFSKIFP